MNEPRGDSWQLNAVRHSDVAAPEQQQRQHTNYNRVRVRVVGTVGAGIGFVMNIKQCSGKSEKNRIVERVVPILPALPFPCHPPSLERHLLVSSVTRTVHC